MDFDSGCTDQEIFGKLKADYDVVFLLCNRKLPFRNRFMLVIFPHGWYDEEKRKRGMDFHGRRKCLYQFPVLFDRISDAWCHRSCSCGDCPRHLAFAAKFKSNARETWCVILVSES